LQLDRLWCNRKGGLGFKELELVNRCLRSTRRISDLVESLLEYAHIQRGQLELRSESFDLALLCGEVLDELEPLATQKGLEIAATLQTNKSFVRSDKVLVRLTLLNLMSNTVKHTEDGVVQVTLRADESYHGVSMANRRNPLGVRRLASALGNVPSGAARVQNDEARDDEFGLTLVREMIAALRGRVEIEAGEDGTSVVTVLIPSHQPTQ
jgi:signal transduction histidine kinase